ncbi:mitochondrial fission 1 protein-like [Clavelina lepadiformis]|uniref:mitochondrial fission 1 protein-like n=1 Tax=Clavelina lepadiformis TaxID=159417 RepID=UPI0040417D1A
MEAILTEKIDPAILLQFEHKYRQEQAMNDLSQTTKFEYAWCLVRSAYKEDWKTGQKLLRELYSQGDEHAKRDYLYYMAIAQYKLQNYDEALKYCEGILTVQPGNHQVKELKRFIEREVMKKGTLGMVAVGAAGLVAGVAAIAATVFVVARKK